MHFSNYRSVSAPWGESESNRHEAGQSALLVNVCMLSRRRVLSTFYLAISSNMKHPPWRMDA